MICTTLGYLERDGQYLMLHRTRKENDISKDKWLGIGGRMEEGETPLEGMIRECREETGLEWNDPILRGIVTFNFRKDRDAPLYCEQMFLFTGSDFSGTLIDCNEGILEWIPKDRIPSLPLWKGDLIFLDLLEKNVPLFFLKLDYIGNDLVHATLNQEDLLLD